MTINLNVTLKLDETDILHRVLAKLEEIQRTIHMTEQELSDKLDGLSTDLSAKLSDISTEIATLKAAGSATPEQLDALGAKVDAMDAVVKGFATT